MTHDVQGETSQTVTDLRVKRDVGRTDNKVNNKQKQRKQILQTQEVKNHHVAPPMSHNKIKTFSHIFHFFS